jgi:hypothetical protein
VQIRQMQQRDVARRLEPQKVGLGELPLGSSPPKPARSAPSRQQGCGRRSGKEIAAGDHLNALGGWLLMPSLN